VFPSHYQVYSNSGDTTETFFERRKLTDSANDSNKEKLKKSKKEIDLMWHGGSVIFSKYSQVPKAIVFISL